MIAKIKLLAKKAIDRAKICWVAVAEKIRSSQILNTCIQKLQSLARKLAEFVKTLWMTKEKHIRWFSLLALPTWLFYNVSCGAYGAAIGNILGIGSILMAMLRYDRPEK